MASVVSGAVIESESGWSLKYRERCDKCGWTGNTTHSTSVMTGTSINTGFSCFKCGSYQTVVIKG